MNKLKQNESGFSAVELLLVLVIVVLLAVVGWFVFTHNYTLQPKAETTNQNIQSEPKKDPIAAKPTNAEIQNWQHIQTTDKHFSLAFPDGWSKINECTGHDGRPSYTIHEPEDMVFQTGKAAPTLEHYCPLNYGAKIPAFRLQESGKHECPASGTQQGALEAIPVGYLTKYTSTLTMESSGEKFNLKNYMVQAHNGVVVCIYYHLQPGQADQTPVVEALISAIKTE